jgi:NAD-dependent deacetylase
LTNSKLAVAFTGAGISTESGIPDFRSPGGVWATSQPVPFDDFLAGAEARYEYWRQKAASHADFMASRPNAGHLALARWQQIGLLSRVITQNIDGLHEAAGSAEVLELHGSAKYVSCLDCEARFDADPWVQRFLADDKVPECPECGGRLKHATISFGQMLPQMVLEQSIALCGQADVCLAIGSSLVVEPAASLPRLAKQSGAKLVIINRDPTPQDAAADIVIRAAIGETLTAINRCLAG